MKKLISLFLVLIMLCAVSVTVFSVSALDENDVLTYDDEELIKPGIKTPTLDDDFEDDGVLFVMTEIASASNPVYTVEDFDESLGVASVRRITSDGAKNHIFYVELDKHDKQNVIDVVKELNKKGGILAAEPNYVLTPVDGYLYKDRFVEQYNLDGDYSYREVNYHYDTNGAVDWCLVKGEVGGFATDDIEELLFEDFVLYRYHGKAPFRMLYGVYDVSKGEFVDLYHDYDELYKYDGLMDALKNLPESKMIGDCDDDGELSILDATQIQLVLAQLSDTSIEKYYDSSIGVFRSFGDFDRDGDVSIMDATAIQRRLARLDVPVATPDEI